MSAPPRLIVLSLLAAAVSIGLPSTADAQILKKLKDAATRAAEDEAISQVERMVRDGVACLFDDLDCIEKAQAAGQDVYLTDEAGDPVVDEEGHTVSDPDQAAGILGRQPPGALPGRGADANVDFEPGDRSIVSDDFTGDNLGDFPRAFELVSGSFDVIDWQGQRYLRALSNGTFAIALPETLPEQFTIETAVSVQHGNGFVAITPGRAYNTRPRDYRGSAVVVRYALAGVHAIHEGPDAMTGHDHDVVRLQVGSELT